MKTEGATNDLLNRLRGEAAFKDVDLDAALEPSQFVGRAPQQVDAFIEQVVAPIRQRYADAIAYDPTLNV